jgi:hypothetical protein
MSSKHERDRLVMPSGFMGDVCEFVGVCEENEYSFSINTGGVCVFGRTRNSSMFFRMDATCDNTRSAVKKIHKELIGISRNETGSLCTTVAKLLLICIDREWPASVHASDAGWCISITTHTRVGIIAGRGVSLESVAVECLGTISGLEIPYVHVIGGKHDVRSKVYTPEGSQPSFSYVHRRVINGDNWVKRRGAIGIGPDGRRFYHLGFEHAKRGDAQSPPTPCSENARDSYEDGYEAGLKMSPSGLSIRSRPPGG